MRRFSIGTGAFRHSIFFTLLFVASFCFAQQNRLPARIDGRIPDERDTRIYVIQVGAYGNQRNADDAISRLQRNGLHPVTEPAARNPNETRVMIKGIPAYQVRNFLVVIARAGFDWVWIREDTSGCPPAAISVPASPSSASAQSAVPASPSSASASSAVPASPSFASSQSAVPATPSSGASSSALPPPNLPPQVIVPIPESVPAEGGTVHEDNTVYEDNTAYENNGLSNEPELNYEPYQEPDMSDSVSSSGERPTVVRDGALSVIISSDD
jgi:hypothetical protein